MLHESVDVEQKLSTGVLLCMLVCAVNAANLCYYLILLTCVCVCKLSQTSCRFKPGYQFQV